MPTAEVEAIMGHPIATQAQFAGLLRSAVENGERLAVGKQGHSELGFLQYPVFLAGDPDPARRRVYEMALGHRSLRAAGIFPTDPDAMGAWCDAYAGHARTLDIIGMDFAAAEMQAEVNRFHGIRATMVRSRHLQPDRSIPAQEDRCWLPALRGKRVLFVGAMAEIVAERANRKTFEAVWAKTGKPWFEPASVDAVTTPYGWAAGTQERFGSSLELLEHVNGEVAKRDFDVALIAAGGIGDGIAAFVAGQGRIGFSMGAHMQVLLGVLTEGWRRESWERYLTDAWIEMADPRPASTGAG